MDAPTAEQERRVSQAHDLIADVDMYDTAVVAGDKLADLIRQETDPWVKMQLTAMGESIGMSILALEPGAAEET